MCYEALPRICKYLNECENIEDLFHLTMCLRNIHKIVPADVWSTYQGVVSRLISNNDNEINHHHLLGVNSLPKPNGRVGFHFDSIPLQIITFITRMCTERDIELVRQLLLKLKPSIQHLNQSELLLVLRASPNQC